MKTLEFYYDIVCPYAYLASSRVEAIASKTGAELVYSPMLLGGVFRSIEAPMFPAGKMSPAKAQYNLLDMSRWADYFGMELTMPASHPQRTVLPMRVITAASEKDRPVVSKALFEAYWVQGIDVASPSELKEVLAAIKIDDEGLLERASSREIKDQLRERTERAVAKGVFGAPAFVVDSELFWGQDRLHFVEEALMS